MAQFEKGNQFWRQRSKVGRSILFSSSALLQEEAEGYFEWCDNNPWYKAEVRPEGKKWVTVKIPVSRPYTWQGLTNYLDCSINYFTEFKKKAAPDFLGVISWIEQCIYQQKFEGASVGAFNANIISRDLGLADSRNVTNTNITVNQPDDEDETEEIGDEEEQ